MDFLSPELFVALGVAVAAGLMRGFAGVGSGMLMAPVFAILFGPVQTVAIIVLMEIVVTGQLLPACAARSTGRSSPRWGPRPPA